MHKHHIIPKHMGGDDDPNNLIELTIEQHAEAHKKLFEKYGHWQDYLAWQGLAGLITKEELVKQLQSNAAKDNLKKNGNPFCGKKTPNNFSINEEHRKRVEPLTRTPEANKKRKNTMAKNKHQQGNKNSQYGWKWCVEETALNLNNRKKVNEIPVGWITTTEWRERRKNKLNNCYGKHWYTDGTRNYFLKESDPLVEKLSRGRIMVVN